jgi:phosphate:Na+ symporter
MFGVFGGLAIFLFGLHYLSDALKKVAGAKLKKLLEKLTSNRVKACAVGAFTTAIIQSSSMTMVTLIGFLNAGILALEQAVWVMLGAEIGTTITAQIIAFKIGTLYLPIIAIGFFTFFFSKSRKMKNIGCVLLGFGLIFMGMHIMSSSVKPLKDEPFFQSMLVAFGKEPIFGVIAGAVFTAIIQSSSATTALVIAMGSANIITLPAAIALTFGANIGTTITAQLASIGSRLSSKRLAFAQSMVNILGVALFFPFIYPFADFVALTSTELPRQIANSHTIFNVIVTAIMLPLSGVLVKLSYAAIKGSESELDRGLKYVNKNIMLVPSIALKQIKKEVQRMSKLTIDMLNLARKALLEDDLESAKHLPEKEDLVDELKIALFPMLEELCKQDLSESDRKQAVMLKGHVIDIERVGDHANNLFELAQKMKELKIKLSPSEKKELKYYFDLAQEAYLASIKLMEKPSQKLFKIVLDNERELDTIQEKIEKIEIRSAKKENAIIMVEALLNLERVSDHAKNILGTIKQGF